MPNQTTTAALAELAGCASNTVTKWARLHGIKPIGRDYLFTPEQVAAFLSRDRKPGRKPIGEKAMSSTERAKRARKKKREKKAIG